MIMKKLLTTMTLFDLFNINHVLANAGTHSTSRLPFVSLDRTLIRTYYSFNIRQEQNKSRVERLWAKEVVY